MKLAINAILGLAFGAFLLWLTISRIDIGDAKSVLAKARYGLMLIAVLLLVRHRHPHLALAASAQPNQAAHL